MLTRTEPCRSASALRTWIGVLLWETPSCTVYRVKGVVAVRDDGGAVRAYAIQAVHQTMSLTPLATRSGSTAFADVAREGGLDRADASTVVVIGRGLNEDALGESFRGV